MLAGGRGGTNNTGYYLYTGQNYWTMSPYYFDDTFAGVFHVNSNGNFGYYLANYAYGVRPVINLSADVTISSGDGTMNNPYVVN